MMANQTIQELCNAETLPAKTDYRFLLPPSKHVNARLIPETKLVVVYESGNDWLALISIAPSYRASVD